MKQYRKFGILLGTILLALGCQKEEVPFFESKPGISFYVGQYETDSIVYSFAYDLVLKNVDTLYLNMRVMGAAEQHARKVTVVAGDGTTARAGVDYELPDAYLPAGALTMQYPVVLFNTPEMAQQQFLLVLDVVANEDLIVGASGREIGTTVATNIFKINVSNILEEPSYWAGIARFFGPFSAVRYRFMVDVIGITDFSSQNIGVSGTYNYPIVLKDALAKYEAEHGPLIDENDVRVTF